MEATSGKKRIRYMNSEFLLGHSERNPAVSKRARMVHDLIESYGLLDSLDEVFPLKCETDSLRAFHSSDYLEVLRKSSCLDDSDAEIEDCHDYGLGFDCPTWNGIYDYVAVIAGATMIACRDVANGLAHTCINWNGGWHHAHRDKAAGYCYVNDIVLGILVLRKTFDRVLYIDLDVHHGDGVQEAFETTKRVFTLSFHQYEPGFFPGTGSCNDCGLSGGKGYAANFPFKSGIGGQRFMKYFKRITQHVLEKYQPQVCVIQCGADVICGDPLGGFNLYPETLIDCVQFVMKENLPTVLLGGGGYNFPNTSRYWTQLTAALCGKVLADDIPDAAQYFLEYGPDYTLEVHRRPAHDLNSSEYLENCAKTIENNLANFNVTCV